MAKVDITHVGDKDSCSRIVYLKGKFIYKLILMSPTVLLNICQKGKWS